jgi:ribulose-phosphate 3-epimerase
MAVLWDGNMQYLPSLACANMLNLASDIEECLKLGLDWFHFDMIDGHYVKNFSLSFDTGRLVKQSYPNSHLDVHLMITNPDIYLDRLAAMGAERIYFHHSAVDEHLKLIHKIKKQGILSGIALNPEEPAGMLESLLGETDSVLLMSIEPGFSGREFIERTYAKLEELCNLRVKHSLNYKISVDGGITASIAKKLNLLGADMLIMGYPTLFDQPDGITQAWHRNLHLMEP